MWWFPLHCHCESYRSRTWQSQSITTRLLRSANASLAMTKRVVVIARSVQRRFYLFFNASPRAKSKISYGARVSERSELVEKKMKFSLRARVTWRSRCTSTNIPRDCFASLAMTEGGGCHREESLTLVKGEWTTWRSRGTSTNVPRDCFVATLLVSKNTAYSFQRFAAARVNDRE